MQAYNDESLKEGKFPSKKSLILLVCTSEILRGFCLQRGINTSKRKWLTKISEKEICIINNNDHCSGLLRSGEGGSEKKKHAHPGTQTNQLKSDDYE